MVYTIHTVYFQNEFVVKRDEKQMYVIKDVGNGYTIYDYDFHKYVGLYKFYKHTGTDYINHAITNEFKSNYPEYKSSHIYLHQFVMKYCGNVPNPENKPQIDHINRNKFDNRLCNLRWATSAEQNQNKFVRADKKPPCDELVAEGINELPRFIRYDKSQERFVLEKHPALVKQVQEGKMKKPQKNGTRKGSIFQRLFDIVTLAMSFESENEILNQCTELEEICNVFNNTQNEPMLMEKSNTLDYEYKLALDKLEKIMESKDEKKVLKKGLPENCGITPDMIPKYCYFKSETETRGCSFVIDKHPKLEKRLWCTTSSKKVDIQEKYETLVNKLSTIEI
jgi:hypothetical protein